MNMNTAWKTYYITCYLLSKFKGIHAMLAEQELFEQIYDFLSGEMSKKELVEYIEMMFGLSKYHLDKAVKSFEESNDYYHQVMD